MKGNTNRISVAASVRTSRVRPVVHFILHFFISRTQFISSLNCTEVVHALVHILEFIVSCWFAFFGQIIIIFPFL